MATETIVVLICDRCGSRHNQAGYMLGNSWAQLTVTWKGDRGGRAYDGAAGGCEIKGKAWLCEPCTQAFVEFFSQQVKP